MNAHARRKESRRLHMELPLGKAVRVADLRNRKVYVYRIGRSLVLDDNAIAAIVSATIHRHVNPGLSGTVDLMLTTKSGLERSICTSPRGLRLLNKEDRAPRPWWSDMRRKAKRSTT